MIRVLENNVPVWYHAAKNGAMLRLRMISGAAMLGMPDDRDPAEWEAEHQGAQQFLLQKIAEKTCLPAQTFAIGEPEAWLFLARRMERLLGAPPQIVVPL